MFFFAPIPPAPFPGGEGGDSRLFHCRGLAPCIPGVEPGRHRNRGGVSRAGGGLAPALPANPAVSIPNGGRGGWGCRPALPLACFVAPYPPSPLPRRGRGRFKVISCKGLRPLHPRVEPGRHRNRGGVSRAGGGACPALPANPAIAVPSGGRNGLGCRPTLPLACFVAPHPPPRPPSPPGKGEPQRLFCRGLRPRHPCTEPMVRRKTDRNVFLWAVPAAKERGDRGRGTSAFEMVLSPGAGRTSAAGVHPPAEYHSGKVSRRPKKPAPLRVPAGQVYPAPPPLRPQKSKRVPGAIPPRTPKNHCRYVSSP